MAVNRISTSTIKQCPVPVPDAVYRCELTPWDLSLLSVRYIQKGLLFYHQNPTRLIDPLKISLSRALFHFCPLAGRLALNTLTPTAPSPSPSSSSSLSICISCNNEGAEFIHARASDVTVSDILTPLDVPPIVESFFAFNGAVNFDGTSLPLLAVQLTELADGFFLGCSFNHVVGDGTAFWHFFTSWAEICRSGADDDHCPTPISTPPAIARWFPDHAEVPIRLPFSKPEEFIDRPLFPPFRDRFFHFSSQSIARLKSKANEECGTGNAISSFQALSAHVWRSVTRARNLGADQETRFRFAMDMRSRLDPPLPRHYFGNAICPLFAAATAGELLTNGLGWAAWRVHCCVADQTSEAAHRAYEKGLREPIVYTLSVLKGCCDVTMGSSPRFDVFGVDFGWGKAAAVRSGLDNKFGGKITAFPGTEGGGSVDLEICLEPNVMSALEADQEFMR